MVIVLAATSAGFSFCCLIPDKGIVWFYFCCVFLASILMTEPKRGMYKTQDYERVRILILNVHEHIDERILSSVQLLYLISVASLTSVLPVSCLLGF